MLTCSAALAEISVQASGQLRQALRQAHPQWQTPDVQWHIQIQGARGSATQACPQGWTWGAINTEHWSRIQIPVHCGQARGSVAATVQAQAKVWVLRQALAQGHVLRTQDLEQAMQTVRNASALQTLEQWLEQPLRKALPAGATPQVRPRAAPLYARKGERIEIQAAEGNIAVSAFGIALHAARKGETLRVRNSASHSVITGELIAPHVVRAAATREGGVKVELESND